VARSLGGGKHWKKIEKGQHRNNFLYNIANISCTVSPGWEIQRQRWDTGRRSGPGWCLWGQAGSGTRSAAEWGDSLGGGLRWCPPARPGAAQPHSRPSLSKDHNKGGDNTWLRDFEGWGWGGGRNAPEAPNWFWSLSTLQICEFRTNSKSEVSFIL